MSRDLRLPSRTAPVVFGGLLSGLMSLLVSGVATFRALGPVDHFVASWISGWLSSWPIAFAAVLVVAPFVRRIVSIIVAPPAVGVSPVPQARTGA
ncbi:MAG: DUF2798 domain-containing protein [Hyphomicrobiaceae bacterium]